MKTFEEIALEELGELHMITDTMIPVYAIACMRAYRLEILKLTDQTIEESNEAKVDGRTQAWLHNLRIDLSTLGDSKEKKNL